MKILLFLVCTLSSVAFAGTCFKPAIKASKAFPAQLCFDSATVSATSEGAKIYFQGGNMVGEFHGEVSEMHGEFPVNKLVVMKNLKEERYESCGSAESLDIIATAYYKEGATKIAPYQVAVQVKRSTTNDICHSPEDTEIIPYTQVR